MKTRKTFFGFIASNSLLFAAIITLALFALSLTGCDNGSTDEDTYPYKVYGIHVTGDVTQARVNTIKDAIDYLVSNGDTNHANYIKTHIKEFKIVAGAGGSGSTTFSGTTANITVGLLDSGGGAMSILANDFWDYADSKGITILQMQNAIRLAMKTAKSKVSV